MWPTTGVAGLAGNANGLTVSDNCILTDKGTLEVKIQRCCAVIVENDDTVCRIFKCDPPTQGVLTDTFDDRAAPCCNNGTSLSHLKIIGVLRHTCMGIGVIPTLRNIPPRTRWEGEPITTGCGQHSTKRGRFRRMDIVPRIPIKDGLDLCIICGIWLAGRGCVKRCCDHDKA